ncbi:glycosyltransferase [Marinimicrobium sp. ARAG 43.8]|uniref:glycosyltransferase n=1 Tax=Marinimicrobium sp. ARAG 43.8 TaxID=3418719 RepID=UPI003CF1DFEB
MILKSRAYEYTLFYIQSKIVPNLAVALYILSRIFLFIGRKELYAKLILTSIRYKACPNAISNFSKNFLSGRINLEGLLSKPCSEKDAFSRAIILSNPEKTENKFRKGVILLSFSHTFTFFLKHELWGILNERYLFVLEPSWSGYADPDIIEFIKRANHCIVQATEITDRALLNSIFPKVPVPDIGASNWVDYSKFDSPNLKYGKLYDALYIANSNPIKRVFRAIESFKETVSICPDFKAVIVCASWGKTDTKDYEKYINAIGLSDNVKIIPGMPQKDLVALASQCKFSILLSLKEGSNRVLFESMFLNLPVICLYNNIGVNKSYINEFTGLLSCEGRLSNSFLTLKQEYLKYHPREWAIDNISPEITTERLRSIINNRFGNEVNSKIYTKVNSPEVQYIDTSMNQGKGIQDLFNRLRKESAQSSE